MRKAVNWLASSLFELTVPRHSIRSAIEGGLTVSLHSDSPMAPLSPLTLAMNTMTRTTINGNDNAASEQITIDQAMRARMNDVA